MSTTLLIDGPNLTMRAVHAGVHGPMSARGIDTAALTIFINSLGALLREESPTYLGIAWDSPEKGFRYILHEGYKANRVATPSLDAKQGAFDLVHEFCDLVGILSVTQATLEADDVIASWWCHAVQGPLLIASSDHDFLQLAGPNPHNISTEILRFGKGGDRWDATHVSEHYHSPEHYPLIAALAGDSSDNIPGIKGIGPKKATKLLERHDWDLESVLDEFPQEREKVRTFLKMINLRDVHIVTQAPRALPTGDPSSELVRFLEHYELAGVLGKLRSGAFWRGVPYRAPSR